MILPRVKRFILICSSINIYVNVGYILGGKSLYIRKCHERNQRTSGLGTK